MGAIAFLYLGIYPPNAVIPAFPHLDVMAALRFVPEVVCLMLLIVAANGWGKAFWDIYELRPTERAVFGTAAGLGIISLLVLAGDLAGLVNPFLYCGIIVAGLALFILRARQFKKGKISWQYLLLLSGASLPLAGSLIGALAPPVQFDSLVYHLALPQQYIDAGRMQLVPYNMFFSFPQNLEMLFQLGMVLDSDILANLIGWSFLFMTGTALFAMTRRFVNTRTAFFAALMWFFTPNILLLATGTYVDLGLAFYVLTSFYALLLWKEYDRRLWLAAAGAFAGLALGIKYTAALPLLLLSLLIIFSAKKNRVHSWSLFIAAAAIAFMPWLFKNALYLKNPIAPWGAAFFGASGIPAEQARQYFAHIYGHGIGIGSLRDLLLIPWRLTVEGFRFGGGFDILGPLFLVFVPLLFFKTEIDRITRIIILFSAGFCILWLFTGKVLRFLVPVMPFICILSAQGLQQVSARRWSRLFAYALFAAILIHNILMFLWVESMVDPYTAVLGSERREIYLGRKVNFYRAVDGCINRLPKGSKTLFVGETRRYYTNGSAIVPGVFDRQPLAAWADEAVDADSLRVLLLRQGITHILLNEHEYRRLGTELQFSAEGKMRWDELRKNACRLIYTDRYCNVYEINH